MTSMLLVPRSMIFVTAPVFRFKWKRNESWCRWPKRCSVKRRVASCPTRSKRSEEHTSELQSLMRISYAVFCLKKKQQHNSLAEIYTENKTEHKIISTK